MDIKQRQKTEQDAKDNAPVLHTESRTLRASMRRRYGSIDIEFSVEKTADLGSVRQQEEVLITLSEQLVAHHERFATEILPKIPNLNLNNGRGGAGNSGSGHEASPEGWKLYTAKELVRETDEKGTRYKIRTTSGRWMKYGCPVYLEDDGIKGFGIPDLMGERFVLPLENVKVWCEDREKGGAVKKIEGINNGR